MLAVAVEQVPQQLQAVQVLVPELLLGARLVGVLLHAGVGGRDDERGDLVGEAPGERLGDARADVVAGQHGPLVPVGADLLEQPLGVAAGALLTLGHLAVEARPEALEGGDVDVETLEQRQHPAVVGRPAGPAVQQVDGAHPRDLPGPSRPERTEGPA